MTELVPLRRNRDFILYQSGGLLSTFGSGISGIAYPLLTLALTHSAAKTGYVGAVEFLPLVILSAPAGVAADRFDRRRLMIAADASRGDRACAAGHGGADGARDLLDGGCRRLRRHERGGALPVGLERGSEGGRPDSATRRRVERDDGANVDGAARRATGRRGALRPLTRPAVSRRRRLVRVLDRRAPVDADTVPGGARPRRAHALPRRDSPTSGAFRSCARPPA